MCLGTLALQLELYRKLKLWWLICTCTSFGWAIGVFKLCIYLFYEFLYIADIDTALSPRNNVPKNKDNKFYSKSLRLQNNALQNIKGLPGMLSTILVDPEALTWLDLSHNELTIIDPVSKTSITEIFNSI